MIDSDTFILVKVYNVNEKWNEMNAASVASKSYIIKGDLYFLTMNGTYHYLVKFYEDLSISFTKKSKINNYLNVSSRSSYSSYKYINDTLFLTFKRKYNLNLAKYTYLTFFSKTDMGFNLNQWKLNLYSPMEESQVSS